MREYELIEKIVQNFPRSPMQRNGFMSCDAEIIDVGNQLLALTIDEFSPEEDFFTDDNPEVLGHNLVAATLSDLYAAGADPFLFLQALTLKKDVNENFLAKLTAGINNSLKVANCFLVGGDLSTGENWRFTGFALGKIAGKRFLQRVLPNEPQILWVTGALGDANLAIMAKTSTPKFELRHEEAKLIQQYATASIDTSGGLFDAVYCLSKQKLDQTIELNLDTVPFADGVDELTRRIGIPREVVLVGGAGEYELLFTTPENISSEIKQKFFDLGITPIGLTYFDKNMRGIFVNTPLSKKPIENALPCPRAAANVNEYFQQVLEFTKKIMNYE